MGGVGGQGQVLQGQFVLDPGVQAVDPVAVEGVQRPAAEGVGEGDRDRDVVAELLDLVRPAEQALGPGRHVAGVEVEAGEPDPGVGEGPAQRVELGLRRGGAVQRPPEFGGVEAGRRRGGGALQQRELGEQDREVHGPALVQPGRRGVGGGRGIQRGHGGHSPSFPRYGMQVLLDGNYGMPLPGLPRGRDD